MARFFTAFLALGLALGWGCARAGNEGGGKATDKSFTLEGKAEAVPAGEKGTATIAIKLAPEAHIEKRAPLSVKLDAQGVQVDKPKLGNADARYDERGATLAVPFDAGKAAGEGKIRADVSFYVCLKDLCEKQDRSVVIPVQVK